MKKKHKISVSLMAVLAIGSVSMKAQTNPISILNSNPLATTLGATRQIARFSNDTGVTNKSDLLIFTRRFSIGNSWNTAETRILQRTDVNSQGHIIFNPKDVPGGLALGTSTLGNDSVLTITADGKVGIGTDSPNAKLNVVGNGIFSGNVTVAALNTSGDTTIGTPGSPNNLLVSGNTTTASLNTTGNATIGTTTSPNNLQVSGNTTTASLNTTGNATIGTTASPNNLVVTGSTTTGALITTGNATIGTTTSPNNLGVSGSVNVAGNINMSGASTVMSHTFLNLAGGISRVQLGTSGTTGMTKFTSTSGNGIYSFETGTGCVKIGAVSTPNVAGYKLFVDQGILTEKVKIAVAGTANWSDYVFNDDYELMPLADVEQFIKTNNHLPNVLSAEEMVQEGNDLGKTDAKLLEKIEELTLYMIEMKKTIEYQNVKIELMERKQK